MALLGLIFAVLSLLIAIAIAVRALYLAQLDLRRACEELESFEWDPEVKKLIHPLKQDRE